MGIVYCANRPARIYELTLGQKDDNDDGPSTYGTTKVTPFSPEGRSARSPRVYYPPPSAGSSSTSSTLPKRVQAVYVSNRLGGVHSSCASLHLLTLDNNGASSWELKDLVSTVASPETFEGFPGLYVDQLPPQQDSFLSLDNDEVQIAFTSVWRSRRVPLLVSLKDGKVTNLAPWPKATEGKNDKMPYLVEGRERELDSFGVFGTDGKGRVLATRSGPTNVPEVVVADLRKGLEKKVEWKVVRKTEVSEEGESSNLLTIVNPNVQKLMNFSSTCPRG